MRIGLSEIHDHTELRC